MLLVFWALRGGGAGSWGVIVNATFKTYPTFQTTHYNVVISANDSATIGAISEAYARHIFDLDSERIGQYFGINWICPNMTYAVSIETYFSNHTTEQAVQSLTLLFTDIFKAGGVLLTNTTNTAIVNDLIATDDDQAGLSATLGSRLIPETVYRNSPKAVGDVYKGLVDAGTLLYVQQTF
jgi:FAD/FMN-containing dehydrogenase